MVRRVDPTPPVDPTPAKRNPNPMDNVTKRPADPGFKEVLERVRGGKSMQDLPDNYSAGGTASSRADGCAVRGKTKGRIV